MNPSEDNTTRAEDGQPGLPRFRTWRGVYLFVIGCFILSVALLAALKWAFS
jgi:hypothetical protein